MAAISGQRSEQGATPLLNLTQVTVRYGTTTALHNVTLQVAAGAHVAVVGPNGAGKSTLFNVIAGLAKPDQGRVEIGGSGPERHLDIGYVPQRNRVNWRFPATVADVVMMGRTGKIGLFRRPSRHDHAVVSEALARVGLQTLATRQIGELSGGQQQRTFLARALAQEAELLLMDEPLSGLDLPNQEAILQILAVLRHERITVMVATHDLNQAAEQFPQVLLLNRRLIAYGPPAEVLTPERLMLAYGSQLHIVQGEAGNLVLTDTCCGGGEWVYPPGVNS